MDYLVVVKMVNFGFSSNAFIQPLLQEVIALLHIPGWRTSVKHVFFYKANRCDDLLANQGHSSLTIDCVLVESIFLALKVTLENDAQALLRLV